MTEFSAIQQAILQGDIAKVPDLVAGLLAQDIAADLILNKGMIPAMDIVGQKFEEGEFFVPEMLVSARAMQEGLKVLKPLLTEMDIKPIGRVVVGTVKGDLHDIGKNLVAMMLEGAGFEVMDLGVDVAPETFVAAVDENVDIVAMSALLTTTMSQMSRVVEALAEAGLRDQVKIMVGGAPVTAEFAEQIGADAYSADASQAATRAKLMVSEQGQK